MMISYIKKTSFFKSLTDHAQHSQEVPKVKASTILLSFIILLGKEGGLDQCNKS